MTEANMIAEPTALGFGLGKAAGFGVGDGSGPLFLHTSGPASALTTTGGVTVPPIVAAATSVPTSACAATSVPTSACAATSVPTSACAATPTGLTLTKLGAASTLTAGAAIGGLLVSMGAVALAGYLTYRLVNAAVK